MRLNQDKSCPYSIDRPPPAAYTAVNDGFRRCNLSTRLLPFKGYLPNVMLNILSVDIINFTVF